MILRLGFTWDLGDSLCVELRHCFGVQVGGLLKP